MMDLGVEICKVKIPKYEDMKTFFKLIINFESDVFLCLGSCVIDAKSIMGLITLDYSKVFSLTIIEKVDGEYDKIKELMTEYGFMVA